MNLKRLGDISFSHLKVDSNLADDSVNEALLLDLQKAGEAAGVVLTITTAKSDHDVNTVNGNTSRHYYQAAVDIAKLDGKGSNGATSSNLGDPDFREKGNKVKNALVAMGYTWNKESGNPKAVLWLTNIGGNHYNHLHVSNKTGAPSDVQMSDIENYTESDSSGSSKNSSGATGPDFWSMVGQSVQDKLLGNVQKEEVKTELNKIKNLMENNILNENIDFKKIVTGGKVSTDGNRTTIHAFSGEKVYSPVNGTVENFDPSICGGLLTIRKKSFKIKNDEFIKICGIKSNLKTSSKIYEGDEIGEVGQSNEISIILSNSQKTSDSEVKKTKEKKINTPRNVTPYTMQDVADLPYKIQALPITLPSKLIWSAYKKLAGIKESKQSLKEEIKDIKRLMN